jgi:hypothetical protein
MGVRIIQGDGLGDSVYACLYCSTSMWAFGPLFEDRDEAELFLEWLGVDPRGLTDRELEFKYSDFCNGKEKFIAEKEKAEEAEENTA